MLKKIVLSLFLVSAISACGKKEEASSDSKVSIGETIAAVSSVSKMADATKEIEKRKEELKKLQFLTNEQLKSVVPNNFGGITRSKLEINGSALVDMLILSARYENEAQEFEVSIFDGAGEMGSNMVIATELMTISGTESESPTGYAKPVTFENLKGMEKQDRSNAQRIDNELSLVVAGRFVATFKSRKGSDMENLKTAIKESKIIEKLNAFK